ncbi:PREDICTED: uncharacterized protein LOC105599020 isoform X2 [Cercocebus atys]|uniref:uncharacterized protein LOC105599020 isoform X2 n=1 Tax=Cercocebus atys TaxID=9531 RepID=UPI0005F3FE39|nr:PREDICTED: uncharacterized protein LOC105599020 isoform X2 [Cercocebus atys]
MFIRLERSQKEKGVTPWILGGTKLKLHLLCQFRQEEERGGSFQIQARGGGCSTHRPELWGLAQPLPGRDTQPQPHPLGHAEESETVHTDPRQSYSKYFQVFRNKQHSKDFHHSLLCGIEVTSRERVVPFLMAKPHQSWRTPWLRKNKQECWARDRVSQHRNMQKCHTTETEAIQSVVLVSELRAVGRPLHQVECEAPTENLGGFSRGAAKSTWVVLLDHQRRAPGALCAGNSNGDSLEMERPWELVEGWGVAGRAQLREQLWGC